MVQAMQSQGRFLCADRGRPFKGVRIADSRQKENGCRSIYERVSSQRRRTFNSNNLRRMKDVL